MIMGLVYYSRTISDAQVRTLTRIDQRGLQVEALQLVGIAQHGPVLIGLEMLQLVMLAWFEPARLGLPRFSSGLLPLLVAEVALLCAQL
ncbi:hypothetical protein ACFX2I_014848 [Malus domestica]